VYNQQKGIKEMKLIEDSNYTVEIEISEANLRALLKDFERNGNTAISRHHQGVMVRVSVKRDEEHYSAGELSRRTSPYLPPEAWAGVR
jgi:hypothetical protein